MFRKIFYSLFLFSITFAEKNSHGHSAHLSAEDFSLFWLIPFIGILLSIAVIPLINSNFWHHNYGKVSAFWGLLFIIVFAVSFTDYTLFYILEVYLREFIPFIMLLLALFTVSGGILIKGDLNGTPKLNTLILLIGTSLASIMGTTGASMLLIRPLIRANSWRKNKVHLIVFFIFLVSNIGGSLTPIGDPPLFLGFLKGVDFTWPLIYMYKPMLFVSFFIFIIFYFLDTYFYKKEKSSALKSNELSIKIEGKINFILILFVIGAVILSGLQSFQTSIFSYHGTTMITLGTGIQLTILLLVTIISLKITPDEIRIGNAFTWEPIKEVAKLFATIFITMIPAIEMLKGVTKEIGPMSWMKTIIINEDGSNIDTMYFWLTGILSSFLDNAPTYVVFFTAALGEHNVEWLMNTGNTLLAISCGAVFMGAMTYIGNAPNFMVKSISEENEIKMPSFFGYMGWSILILFPIFIVTSLIFF
ncbi:MAG: sodium:proton antiporter [Candidatus Marinimicrobia bacterium]|nr:sodium:proton antiporter [Candidatus Neomarinimicrobiota bacterium]|tara:strand:+ start:13772 stop:15193 length:1422 start_codon:yes stop_codon:yes gene_type:complete